MKHMPLGIAPEVISPIEVARDMLDQRTTIEKVRDAVAQGRVFVAFQPIVNAKDFRKILAFEALVRIVDEHGRQIQAGSFINEIEGDELGRIIDARVLLLCVKKLLQQRKAVISINVSARSIGFAPWRNAIEEAMKKDRSIQQRMILEFTEASVNTVPEYLSLFMKEMRSTGLNFALDNFGIHGTTFDLFRNFLFDFIKFDNTITNGSTQSVDREALVGALVEFSHCLGMGVVVDRIEAQEDADLFNSLNVDYFQGFAFGEPVIDKKLT